MPTPCTVGKWEMGKHDVIHNTDKQTDRHTDPLIAIAPPIGSELIIAINYRRI